MKKYIFIILIISYGFFIQAQVKKSQKKGFVVYLNKLPNVNSEKDEVEELCPVISKDGKHLFFVRIGDSDNTAYDEFPNNQDIWYSEKKNGEWTKPVNLGEPVNNKYHNVVCGTNEDGSILYLSNEYKYDKKGNLINMGPGLSYSEKQDNGTWSKPINLKINGLKAHHIDPNGHFYYHRSDDGRMILFSASLIRTEEDEDEEEKIFVCFQSEKDENVYDNIIKLSDKINSKGTSETAPFLSEDGMKLYFTSLRRNNQAELHVVERKIDKSEVNSSDSENWENASAWGKVEPLYEAYNYSESALHHVGFEGYFVLHRENKLDVDIDDYGLLSMSKEKGAADIYELNFRRYHKLKVITLEEVNENGKKTMKPFNANASLKSKNFANITPIEKSGNISFYSFYRKPDTTTFRLVEEDKSLILDTKKQDYTFEVNYKVPEDYELLVDKSQTSWKIGENIFQGNPEDDLSTIKLIFKKKEPIALQVISDFMVTVNYDWDSHAIRAMERDILNELSTFLKKYNDVKLTLYGHTDNTGTPELKNNKLSESRANSVFFYLRDKKKISTERMVKKLGYSEFKPKKQYDTETKDEVNRRTEIILSNLKDIDKKVVEDLCETIKTIRGDYIKNNPKRLEMLNGSDCFKIVNYSTAAPPRKNCRVFFTGCLVGGEYKDSEVSQVYKEDKYSEYVGAGEYPDNSEAFPKAVETTFDGIAIGRKTRVIIYSEPNFKGKELLNKVGPIIINNVKWKGTYDYCNTETYPADLQALFPPSLREWSETDMNSWSFGSVRIICEE